MFIYLSELECDFNSFKLGPKSYALNTIRKYLGHRSIDYLKMDLGSNQLATLQHLLDNNQLLNVKQMGIKFRQVNPKPDILLRRLETSGFVRFFTRENYMGNSGYDIAWFNTNFSKN